MLNNFLWVDQSIARHRMNETLPNENMPKKKTINCVAEIFARFYQHSALACAELSLEVYFALSDEYILK